MIEMITARRKEERQSSPILQEGQSSPIQAGRAKQSDKKQQSRFLNRNLLCCFLLH